MSIDFHLEKPVRAGDLLDGRLIPFGVREHINELTGECTKCLTDGTNYVWLYIGHSGFVSSLTRYAENCPNKILECIATAFDTEVFSEQEPQFYGFDTQEELDAAMEKSAEQLPMSSTRN